MEKQDQMKIDQFFKRSIKKHNIVPEFSTDFTENVMHKLEQNQSSYSKYSKPILDWKFKLVYGIFFFGIILISWLLAGSSTISYSFQLPQSILNLLSFYSEFFTSGDNLILIIASVSLGIWSLLLLDKILNRVTLG